MPAKLAYIVAIFTTHEHGVVSVMQVWLHFWHAGTSSEYLGQGRTSRSSGQGHRDKSVSVRPLRALISECFDPETSFWFARTSTMYLGRGRGHGVKGESYMRN